MSEPMTSGEIEDVLSSIRKLVSEDLRPQPRTPVPTQAATQALTQNPPPEADKLMLTPALRVVEGNAEAEATLAAMPDAAPARRLRLDTVVSTFAARVSPPSEGWEAEAGDATVTRLVRPPPKLTECDDAVEPFPDEDVADDGAAIRATALDPAPPVGLRFASLARADEPDDEDTEAPIFEMGSGAEFLPGPGDASGDEVPGEPEVASEGPIQDFDADVLSELVRDILREELQGALGERMTRNIRKLVRAEVARILATRDLA